MGPFKPMSDYLILLLKTSHWRPMSLWLKPQFLQWPTRPCGLLLTFHPTPIDCLLSDLSPTTLPFVTFAGVLALLWKYRVCFYVRAFALAFLLGNSLRCLCVLSLTSFRSLFKWQGGFSGHLFRMITPSLTLAHSSPLNVFYFSLLYIFICLSV